jgi:hypothetical protein
MRFSRLWMLALLVCCGRAGALSIDGNLQFHAAVGAPLSVSVPISLQGDENSRIYYRLTPATGLADAEERAAAAVHAGYDPSQPAIVLSTTERMAVPAMRLHLEVGVGSVVVGRELTVLFDIPDLNRSSPLETPAAGAAPAPTVGAIVAAVPGQAPAASGNAAAPGETRSIAIGKEEDQKTPIAFGDAAAGGTAPGAPKAAPDAGQMVIAPRPRYFNTYQVKNGETLSSIAAHFAKAGAGGVDAVMLAIYEANIDDFPPHNPQHPIVGRLLGIPDAPSIGTEPAYRVAEFKEYLRRPLGEWQVPVTLLRKPADPVLVVPKQTPPWLQPHNLIGAAAVLLVLWGLRKLFAGGRHKREMSARRAQIKGGGSAASFTPQFGGTAPGPASERAVVAGLPPAPPEAEQAEISRLRELLEQQPGRADIRLRLVQRLFEARRAAGFAEVALPLEAVLSVEAWERVRAMGHELVPGDFRFQPQAPFAPSPELLSLLEQQENTQRAAAPAAAAGTIDFDFHGEMARVDKTRSDVFGRGDGDDDGGKRAA